MEPFRTIHLEISGVCNAKCPYCIAGSGNQPQGGFMDIEVLKAILKRLIETGLVEKNLSTLALYNWGEPFLHPKIKEVIDIINEFQFKYAFSTNASVIPEIDNSFVKNLKLAIISMPGFSQ